MDDNICYFLGVTFYPTLITIHHGKNLVHKACIEGQFYVVNNQFKAFSINLNAQHVNGLTHFD